jgi:F-type H+-transporting ATPase subunit a
MHTENSVETLNTTQHSESQEVHQASLLFPHPHMPGVKADEVFQIAGWPVSNSTTFLLFITVLFFLFYFAVKKFKAVPGFFQSLVEMLLESIEGLLTSLTGGKSHRVAQLMFPIATIFLVVGSINIIGSFPIINQFTIQAGEHVVPLFRKATSDINVTLPLALAIVLSMQVFGVINWGFFGYFKRFFPLHTLWHETKHHGVGGFFMGVIELFVGLLEFISECVKVVSLSLRLFGNMFAGEILLAILTGIFAIALPAVWLGFDFMVAVIQTIVIGCLTSVYYVLVVKEEGQESGH